MTLMFGNLTVTFVDFGTAAQNAFQHGATPQDLQALNDAANHFKSVAAKDALYLAILGKYICRTSIHQLNVSRNRHADSYLWVHGDLDSNLRSRS
jgi:hypothetical protein